MKKAILIPQKHKNKEFFRPDEVAEILSVSVRQVYHYIKEGRIESPVRESPIRIPRRALVEYLKRICPGWSIE